MEALEQSEESLRQYSERLEDMVKERTTELKKLVNAMAGREGIALAERVKPTLILLDIQLPGMDGYTVARKLRSNPAFDEVPIEAVTSYAMVGDREQILAAGCDGYIEKPINPETFMDDIEQHL
jgi:two-component system cell cycle response regulator DivK